MKKFSQELIFVFVLTTLCLSVGCGPNISTRKNPRSPQPVSQPRPSQSPTPGNLPPQKEAETNPQKVVLKWNIVEPSGFRRTLVRSIADASQLNNDFQIDEPLTLSPDLPDALEVNVFELPAQTKLKEAPLQVILKLESNPAQTICPCLQITGRNVFFEETNRGTYIHFEMSGFYELFSDLDKEEKTNWVLEFSQGDTTQITIHFSLKMPRS